MNGVGKKKIVDQGLASTLIRQITKNQFIILNLKLLMIYCDIVIYIEIIQMVACNGCDGFSHINFIFLKTIF